MIDSPTINNAYYIQQINDINLEKTNDSKEVYNQLFFPLFYEARNNIGQKILILGINHYLDASLLPSQLINSFINTQFLMHETRYADITSSAKTLAKESLQFSEKLSLQLLKGNWSYFAKILNETQISKSKIKKYKNLFLKKHKGFKKLIDGKWLDQLPEEARISVTKAAKKYEVNLDVLHPLFISSLINFESFADEKENESAEQFLIESFVKQNKQRLELDSSEIVDKALSIDFIIELADFNFKETLAEIKDIKNLNKESIIKFVLDYYQTMGENSQLWELSCMLENLDEDLLVSYRNHIWESSIQKSLALGGDSYSLLVGYDHLNGKNGLLQFLINQNFEIRQILVPLN